MALKIANNFTYNAALIFILLNFATSAFAGLDYYLQKKFHVTPYTFQRASSWKENSSNHDVTTTHADSSENVSDNFDQVIDHFAGVVGNASSAKSVTSWAKSMDDGKTFKQRFYINTALATSLDAPVFFSICGEADCTSAEDVPEINFLAKKFGGFRVALEHRYYGKSQPFAQLTNENLKYLSVDQAIEDLASFQKYVQQKYKMTGKWIAVGGSYAGALAAFYRLKHPELVSGALSSSGPVLMKADFKEYDYTVATQLQSVNPTCLENIKSAVKAAENILSDTQNPNKIAELKKLFQAEAVTVQADFLYIMADMAAIAIQYGHRDYFCHELNGASTNAELLQNYARSGVKLFRDFGMTPAEDGFMTGASNVDAASYEGKFALRAWMYQSCTQFGYYQTFYPDEKYSARSKQISLAYHDETCLNLFGLTQPVNTDIVNKKYYQQLLTMTDSRIFYTNGSDDPWKNLSFFEGNPDLSTHPDIQYFTIANAAHCADLGSGRSDELMKARNKFADLVADWLSK